MIFGKEQPRCDELPLIAKTNLGSTQRAYAGEVRQAKRQQKGTTGEQSQCLDSRERP